MCPVPVVVPAGRGADMEAAKASRSSSSSTGSSGPQRIRNGYIKCMSLVRTQTGNRIERVYYR